MKTKTKTKTKASFTLVAAACALLLCGCGSDIEDSGLHVPNVKSTTVTDAPETTTAAVTVPEVTTARPRETREHTVDEEGNILGIIHDSSLGEATKESAEKAAARVGLKLDDFGSYRAANVENKQAFSAAAESLIASGCSTIVFDAADISSCKTAANDLAKRYPDIKILPTFD